MPPNLLRCQFCRGWLNKDLTRPEPVAPEMFALPEIPPPDAALAAYPAGHYVICPACRRELRVADQYVGQTVACKYCSEPFRVTTAADAEPPRVAFYLDCPHCLKEIRASVRYLEQRVACKHCDGPLHLTENRG